MTNLLYCYGPRFVRWEPWIWKDTMQTWTNLRLPPWSLVDRYRRLFFYSSALEMEATRYSKILAPVCQTIRLHNLNIHRRVNAIAHARLTVPCCVCVMFASISRMYSLHRFMKLVCWDEGFHLVLAQTLSQVLDLHCTATCKTKILCGMCIPQPHIWHWTELWRLVALTDFHIRNSVSCDNILRALTPFALT
jgi:hypothetical protein